MNSLTQEKKAKAYNQKKIFTEIAETIILLVFLVFFMVTGWSSFMKTVWYPVSTSPWIVNGLYTLAFFLVIKIVTFPLDFYSGFILEHHYNLSNQKIGPWLIDQLKELAVISLFSLLIVEIIYTLLRYAPTYWWLIISGILCFFFILITKLAPVFLMPLFFSFQKICDPDLEARLHKLTKKAHTKITGIFEMKLSQKSKTANAALAGIGQTRRIILSDTLLNNYTHEEIETIMAHELGHHVYNHLWKGIAVQSTLILILFFTISCFLAKGVIWFHLENIYDVAGLPYLTLIGLLFSLFFLPVVNSYLRCLEYQSDHYSLSITGKPAVFIKALEKISQQNLSEMQPNPIIEFIFYSHPCIAKRINRLQSYGSD